MVVDGGLTMSAGERQAMEGAISEPKEPTVAEALQDWRTAERVAAVARRGRVASEEAALAAQEAAEAAIATAEAAKGALAAMTLAEASAAKTAKAAKLAALSLDADLADAVSDTALADVDEVAAQGRYRDATTRAASKRSI
jgi:hypothetical protein